MRKLLTVGMIALASYALAQTPPAAPSGLTTKPGPGRDLHFSIGWDRGAGYSKDSVTVKVYRKSSPTDTFMLYLDQQSPKSMGCNVVSGRYLCIDRADGKTKMCGPEDHWECVWNTYRDQWPPKDYIYGMIFCDPGGCAPTNGKIVQEAELYCTDNGGNGCESSYKPLSPATPEPPSNLSASVISSSQINLAWTDNSTNESGFSVERCTGSGCTNFVQIAQLGVNATSYVNTGLSAGVTYTYRVRAFNAAGNSSYSNVAEATTMLFLATDRVVRLFIQELISDLIAKNIGLDHLGIEAMGLGCPDPEWHDRIVRVLAEEKIGADEIEGVTEGLSPQGFIFRI